MEQWQPGQRGKAAIYGSLHEPLLAGPWHVDAEGYPNHYVVMPKMGVYNFIALEVEPDGGVSVLFGDPKAADDAAALDPRLHVKSRGPHWDFTGHASEARRGPSERRWRPTQGDPSSEPSQALRTAENASEPKFVDMGTGYVGPYRNEAKPVIGVPDHNKIYVGDAGTYHGDLYPKIWTQTGMPDVRHARGLLHDQGDGTHRLEWLDGDPFNKFEQIDPNDEWRFAAIWEEDEPDLTTIPAWTPGQYGKAIMHRDTGQIHHWATQDFPSNGPMVKGQPIDGWPAHWEMAGHHFGRDDAMMGNYESFVIDPQGQVRNLSVNASEFPQRGFTKMVADHIGGTPDVESSGYWRFAAQDLHGWTPGRHGKGFVLTDGTPVTWNTDGHTFDEYVAGGPHHTDVALKMGLGMYPEAGTDDAYWTDGEHGSFGGWHTPIYIHPNGGVHQLDYWPNAETQGLDAFEGLPGLNVPKEDEWHFAATRPWTLGEHGKGFIHPDGTVQTWVTNGVDPTHAEMVASNDAIEDAGLWNKALWIHPDGSVIAWEKMHPEDIERVHQQVPGTRVDPETEAGPAVDEKWWNFAKVANNWTVNESNFDPAETFFSVDEGFPDRGGDRPVVVHKPTNQIIVGPPGSHHADLINHHELDREAISDLPRHERGYHEYIDGDQMNAYNWTSDEGPYNFPSLHWGWVSPQGGYSRVGPVPEGVTEALHAHGLLQQPDGSVITHIDPNAKPMSDDEWHFGGFVWTDSKGVQHGGHGFISDEWRALREHTDPQAPGRQHARGQRAVDSHTGGHGLVPVRTVEDMQVGRGVRRLRSAWDFGPTVRVVRKGLVAPDGQTHEWDVDGMGFPGHVEQAQRLAPQGESIRPWLTHTYEIDDSGKRHQVWAKTASIAWTPGSYGKAHLIKGQLHSWNVDAEDGRPSHTDMMERGGHSWDDEGGDFHITPEGELELLAAPTHMEDDEWPYAYEQALKQDPRLRRKQEGWDFRSKTRVADWNFMGGDVTHKGLTMSDGQTYVEPVDEPHIVEHYDVLQHHQLDPEQIVHYWDVVNGKAEHAGFGPAAAGHDFSPEAGEINRAIVENRARTAAHDYQDTDWGYVDMSEAPEIEVHHGSRGAGTTGTQHKPVMYANTGSKGYVFVGQPGATHQDLRDEYAHAFEPSKWVPTRPNVWHEYGVITPNNEIAWYGNFPGEDRRGYASYEHAAAIDSALGTKPLRGKGVPDACSECGGSGWGNSDYYHDGVGGCKACGGTGRVRRDVEWHFAKVAETWDFATPRNELTHKAVVLTDGRALVWPQRYGEPEAEVPKGEGFGWTHGMHMRNAGEDTRQIAHYFDAYDGVFQHAGTGNPGGMDKHTAQRLVEQQLGRRGGSLRSPVSSQHELNWKPGTYGKGILTNEGTLRTWTCDDEGNPHHEDMERGRNDAVQYLLIDPGGETEDPGMGWTDPSVYKIDPRLKPAPEGWHFARSPEAQAPVTLSDGRELSWTHTAEGGLAVLVSDPDSTLTSRHPTPKLTRQPDTRVTSESPVATARSPQALRPPMTQPASGARTSELRTALDALLSPASAPLSHSDTLPSTPSRVGNDNAAEGLRTREAVLTLYTRLRGEGLPAGQALAETALALDMSKAEVQQALAVRAVPRRRAYLAALHDAGQETRPSRRELPRFASIREALDMSANRSQTLYHNSAGPGPMRPWKPGVYGKGVVIDGQAHSWRSDSPHDPHHDDVLDNYLTDGMVNSYFTIDPRGEVEDLGASDEPMGNAQIAALDPRFKPAPEGWHFANGDPGTPAANGGQVPAEISGGIPPEVHYVPLTEGARRGLDDWGKRQTFIYTPHNNRLFVGEPGNHHGDLMNHPMYEEPQWENHYRDDGSYTMHAVGGAPLQGWIEGHMPGWNSKPQVSTWNRKPVPENVLRALRDHVDPELKQETADVWHFGNRGPKGTLSSDGEVPSHEIWDNAPIAYDRGRTIWGEPGYDHDDILPYVTREGEPFYRGDQRGRIRVFEPGKLHIEWYGGPVQPKAGEHLQQASGLPVEQIPGPDENGEWRFGSLAPLQLPKGYIEPDPNDPEDEHKGLVMKDGQRILWSLYGPRYDQTTHAALMDHMGIDPHDVAEYIDSRQQEPSIRTPHYQQQYIDNFRSWKFADDQESQGTPAAKGPLSTGSNISPGLWTAHTPVGFPAYTGQNGKGVILKDGTPEFWAVDDVGNPGHERWARHFDWNELDDGWGTSYHIHDGVVHPNFPHQFEEHHHNAVEAAGLQSNREDSEAGWRFAWHSGADEGSTEPLGWPHDQAGANASPITVKMTDETGTAGWDYGDDDFDRRRPVLYHMPTKTLYVGGYGQYHSEAADSHGINEWAPQQARGMWTPEGVDKWQSAPGQVSWFDGHPGEEDHAEISRLLNADPTERDPDEWHFANWLNDLEVNEPVDEPFQGHNLEWVPGEVGRGILRRNGEVHTWHNNSPYDDNYHHDYEHIKGFQPFEGRAYFFIQPDGRYDGVRDAKHKQAIEQADSRLHQYDPSEWHMGSVGVQNGNHNISNYLEVYGPKQTTPWQPGLEGKGAILDGQVHTWAIGQKRGPFLDDNGYFDPHHDGIFAHARGLNSDQLYKQEHYADYQNMPKFYLKGDGTIEGTPVPLNAEHEAMVQQIPGVRGQQNDWHFGANLPQVAFTTAIGTKYEPWGPDSVTYNTEGRNGSRPIVYDPHRNFVGVGPVGAHHNDITDAIKDQLGPEHKWEYGYVHRDGTIRAMSMMGFPAPVYDALRPHGWVHPDDVQEDYDPEAWSFRSSAAPGPYEIRGDATYGPVLYFPGTQRVYAHGLVTHGDYYRNDLIDQDDLGYTNHKGYIGPKGLTWLGMNYHPERHVSEGIARQLGVPFHHVEPSIWEFDGRVAALAERAFILKDGRMVHTPAHSHYDAMNILGLDISDVKDFGELVDGKYQTMAPWSDNGDWYRENWDNRQMWIDDAAKLREQDKRYDQWHF